MNDAISVCGFNCGLCPAYKPNLKSEEDRLKVDDGWKNFHKTRGWVYKDHHCEGCFNDPQQAPLWSSCPLRKCVLGNKIDNCGYCLDYPCPRLNNMTRVINVIAERTRKTGTEDDFQKFVLPHLSQSRLDEINQKFMESQPTDYHPVNTTTIRFPAQLNPKALAEAALNVQEFQTALHNLHFLLESIMTLHCRTIGGQEQELKRNKEIAKFLWVIGKHGKLRVKDEGCSIEITPVTIKNQLRYGKYRLQRKLEELSRFQIESSYSEDMVTIRFSEKPETAIVLQKYMQFLLEKYKERTAYTKFWKADMWLFTE